MPTPQETKQDVMSKVNSVIAALNLYPELTPTNTQLSFNRTENPIDLLIDFFKTTKGYDWLINVVSKFISFELPALELAVKGVLLANIRVMLSCSVSPIITQRMINDGIIIDLDKTDLLKIFNYSPLIKDKNNPGKYFYFGCDPEDGITTMDDLKYSRDFNAVLWYAKNTPGDRIVWRRERDLDKDQIVKRINEEKWAKQSKSNGIATIEFNGRSSGLRKADGSLHFIQEPIDNCLHLFIGYCVPQESNTSKDEIARYTKILSNFNSFNDKIDEYRKEIRQAKREKIKEAKNHQIANPEVLNKINADYKSDLHLLDRLQHAINGVDIDNPESSETTINGIMHGESFELNTIHEVIRIPQSLLNSSTIIAKGQKIDYMQQSVSSTLDYPSAKSNYYYLHPLFEWNADFIMSIKLFDEKVVAAQLIEALTRCLSFSATFELNVQTQYIQQQIQQLVEKIIETDDAVVSDCFFSFSNDSYNEMLSEVELNRASLHFINNNTVNNIPSASEIMDSLNTLSHDATQEELQSAISGSLFSASRNTTSDATEKGLSVNAEFKANYNIIDDLLTQLVYVMVSTIFQPKVYTLLLANLTVLGNEPNFDLTKFMQQFGDLISALIREIRDKVLEYFKMELTKVLAEIVSTLTVRITLEQYQYYITLLNHCIECFKIHQGDLGFDWVQDNVDYADITELNQQENQEC